MCITSSGEYAHEKITSDKIFIGYAPTATYNNDEAVHLVASGLRENGW